MVDVLGVWQDVPSRASEFSHPDVVIGATILAYRHEGLRRTDFLELIAGLREGMSHEYGPYTGRQSCKKFRRWVELSGGRVRGFKKTLVEDAPVTIRRLPDIYIDMCRCVYRCVA